MKKEMQKIFLVDTNIFVYALARDAGAKHKKAKQLVRMQLEEGEKIVSLQILGEFYNVISKRAKTEETKKECTEIIDCILKMENIKKIGYGEKTLAKAMELSAGCKKPFWDCVIASAMLENQVVEIYTENTADFEGIAGINAINPFER